ncbi:hypothetical protein NIES2101_39755 [Calothrix sp. HK-06]|nr:hypothetical protein NIES2101_39755 [Calothrix sp. HK-06]
MSEIFGLFPEESNLNFNSIYTPFICFKNKHQKQLAEKYVAHEVSLFFTQILNKTVPVTELAYPKIITDQDFKTVDIKYFYDNLFYDLGERQADGKLLPKIKWGITFDEKCAPIKVGWINPNFDGSQHEIRPFYTDREGSPYRRYGTIDINGTPIFYYIYFTIQEILNVIRQVPTP